jgi:hypothetical protein
VKYLGLIPYNPWEDPKLHIWTEDIFLSNQFFLKEYEFGTARIPISNIQRPIVSGIKNSIIVLINRFMT